MVLLRILIVGILIGGTIPPASGAGIELDQGLFDFGFVPQNVTVVHQAWIKSNSKDTLTITEIKTGCGCLTPEPLSRPLLLPGDSQSVVFYWQTRGSLGEVRRSAFIYTGLELTPLELVLTANVVTDPPVDASLTWTPLRVLFDIDMKRERLSREIGLTNNSESDITLTVIENSPQFELRFPDTINAGTTAAGELRMIPGNESHEFESSFTIEVSGNQTAPYRVSVPVVSGDFSFRPFFTTTDKK